MKIAFNLNLFRNIEEKIQSIVENNKDYFNNKTIDIKSINPYNLQNSLNMNDDEFLEFINDFYIDIFGFSKEKEDINILNKLKEQGHEIGIFFFEPEKIKNATLYYISKYNVAFDWILTLNNNFIDEYFDYIITDNVSDYENSFSRDKIILLETKFNQDFKINKKIKNVREITDLL